jgi:hypothetical protein
MSDSVEGVEDIVKIGALFLFLIIGAVVVFGILGEVLKLSGGSDSTEPGAAGGSGGGISGLIKSPFKAPDPGSVGDLAYQVVAPAPDGSWNDGSGKLPQLWALIKGLVFGTEPSNGVVTPVAESNQQGAEEVGLAPPDPDFPSGGDSDSSYFNGPATHS